MAIKRAQDLDFSEKKFTLILSGQPGLGKTTLALSAPDPILFDLDNGISRVKAEHRKLTSVVDAYEELLADMESEEYKAAKTVILDTGGSLVQLMQPWAKQQDAKAARDGRAMFGVIKREFDRLTHMIRTEHKKHCVIIFHTTEVQKGDVVTTRLSCEGSAKDIVWTPADLGGYLHMMGQKRCIGFTPTEEYFAKACFGIQGVRVIPELKPGQPNDFLTRLFAEAQQNLASEMAAYAPQREAYESIMAQADAILEQMTNLETLNANWPALSELPQALTSKAEIGAKLKAKAALVGATYSKEAKAYVPIDSKSA